MCTRDNLLKEKTKRRMEEPDCLSPDEINAAEVRNSMQQQQKNKALPGDPGEAGAQIPDHQGPIQEDNEDGVGADPNTDNQIKVNKKMSHPQVL